ncbi:MAG: PA2778 family cysteine peptidase [Pseudomonadota bacterium]
MSLFFRLICCLFFIISGCAKHVPIFTENPQRGIELVDTPFFTQKDLQCGPAALAMVLKGSGIETDPDRLTPQIFLPERRGTLQLELVAAVRRHGRIPYVVDSKPDALVAQLMEGRPVLILQDLGAGPISRYHYAVVVGILTGNRVVLRSGPKKRLIMGEDRFARSWQKAGSWGLVVLRPDELPDGVDPDRYVKAVSAFENMGQWEVAAQGYQAALARWPHHKGALFGLGNGFLVRREYGTAEKIYKKILEEQPDNPAVLNNLAEAYFRQGFSEDALTAIDHALSIKPLPPDFAEVMEQTRKEILDASPAPASEQ